MSQRLSQEASGVRVGKQTSSWKDFEETSRVLEEEEFIPTQQFRDTNKKEESRRRRKFLMLQQEKGITVMVQNKKNEDRSDGRRTERMFLNNVEHQGEESVVKK